MPRAKPPRSVGRLARRRRLFRGRLGDRRLTPNEQDLTSRRARITAVRCPAVSDIRSAAFPAVQRCQAQGAAYDRRSALAATGTCPGPCSACTAVRLAFSSSARRSTAGGRWRVQDAEAVVVLEHLERVRRADGWGDARPGLHGTGPLGGPGAPAAPQCLRPALKGQIGSRAIAFSIAPLANSLSLWRHRSRPDRTTRQPSPAIAFPESDRPACLPGTTASDGERSRTPSWRDRNSTIPIAPPVGTCFDVRSCLSMRRVADPFCADSGCDD